MAGSGAGAKHEGKKEEKTALRWWTECLHSYLMSYFFSEVGEMEPGGWSGGRWMCVWGGDLAVNAQLSIGRPSSGPGAHPPKHSSPERAKVTPLLLRSGKTRRMDEEFGHLDARRLPLL